MENMNFIPYNEEQRFDQIKRNIPSFLTQEFKDLLYIGVSKKHFQFSKHFDKYNVTLLEAHSLNLEYFINKYTCINADITTFETEDKWDVVMWWHGPEHISKEELKPTLQKLERISNKLVILGCPFGRYIQGIYNNNSHQIHKNHIYPSDLLELDYSVETIGRLDLRGSNILAWKVL